MTPVIFIYGLGLMGGSLAAACTRAGAPVLLHHRRQAPIDQAVAQGYGEAVGSIEAGMARADIAVICTPVSCIVEHVRRCAAAPGQAVITDVGSTKGSIIAELHDLAESGRFVGSHPMAGSHLQGIEHSNPDLYRGAISVLTPLPETPNEATERIASLWRLAGASCLQLPPDEHDQAVAEASHLPHILAAATAKSLSERGLPLAASGFRDTSRIAAGSPALWRDILLENRDAVIASLRHSLADQHSLLNALDQSDGPSIESWLAQAQASRQRFDQIQRRSKPAPQP